jgi:hypothetical protein
LGSCLPSNQAVKDLEHDAGKREKKSVNAG